MPEGKNKNIIRRIQNEKRYKTVFRYRIGNGDGAVDEHQCITYNAIDGLYIGGTGESNLFYQGAAYESDTAYYGVGWTYSGKDGETPLNENNYMSQNTINNDGSRVILSYANYYYPKAASK